MSRHSGTRSVQDGTGQRRRQLLPKLILEDPVLFLRRPLPLRSWTRTVNSSGTYLDHTLPHFTPYLLLPQERTLDRGVCDVSLLSGDLREETGLLLSGVSLTYTEPR